MANSKKKSSLSPHQTSWTALQCQNQANTTVSDYAKSYTASNRAWYHHLQRFLTEKTFSCNTALPCIFAQSEKHEFVILAVYVDDNKLVGSPKMCERVEQLLVAQFEMKLFGRTSFCLGLQVHHCPDRSIYFHQKTYTKKLLQSFNMAEAKSTPASIIDRSKSSDNPYRPCE